MIQHSLAPCFLLLVLTAGCRTIATQSSGNSQVPLLPQESAPIFSKVKREVSKDGIIYYFFPGVKPPELAKLVERQKFFIDERWDAFVTANGLYMSGQRRSALKEGDLNFIRIAPERFERGTMRRIPTTEGSTIVLGTYSEMSE